MRMASQKKLAAEILGVGTGKIWFDPIRIEDIGQAITRADIKDLIKDKAIRLKQNTNKAKPGRKTKAKRGKGRRKIMVGNRKRMYINRIRKMREFLDKAHKKGEMTGEDKKKLRRLAKAGQFRSLKHLKESLKPAV
jgi:large subunit ribosomal protein L19e